MISSIESSNNHINSMPTDRIEQLSDRVLVLETKLYETTDKLNKIDQKLDVIKHEISKFKGSIEAKRSVLKTTLKIIQILVTMGAGGGIVKFFGL